MLRIYLDFNKSKFCKWIHNISKYIIYELSEMYSPIPLREEGRILRWRKREEGVKAKKGEGGGTNFVKNFRNFEILTPESCFRLKIV